MRTIGVDVGGTFTDLVYCDMATGDLVIHKVYDGGWFVGRPTIDELRQDLRTLMGRYHPD